MTALRLSAATLLGAALLAGAPARATNTDERAELQVTLKDGATLEGRLDWRPTRLFVRGSRTKKVDYAEIASIGLVPDRPLAARLAPYERRLKRLDEEDPEAWVRLGEWCRREGLSEQAEAAFARALALDPERAEARWAQGELQDASGAWVPAAQVLRDRRAEVRSGDLDGLVDLARFCLEHEQRGAAFDLLCEVLRADSYHASALRLIKPMTDAYRQKTAPLRLPVRGRWRVSPDRTRHHQKKGYAVYALDLNEVDAEGKIARGSGRKLEDYYAFGAAFYAVAAGKVTEVRDGFPDNAVGKIGGRGGKHNGVSIDHGNGEHSWYIHAKNGSIVVKEGDLVEAGQKLGEVGNSGGSALPHLHFTLVAYHGLSVPWHCDDYRVIAPDGTAIAVTRAWPSEGWTLELPEE